MCVCRVFYKLTQFLFLHQSESVSTLRWYTTLLLSGSLNVAWTMQKVYAMLLFVYCWGISEFDTNTQCLSVGDWNDVLRCLSSVSTTTTSTHIMSAIVVVTAYTLFSANIVSQNANHVGLQYIYSRQGYTLSHHSSVPVSHYRDFAFYCSNTITHLNYVHINVTQPVVIKVKLYKHLCPSSNSILYNLFYFTLIHNYTSDRPNMLKTVFMPQCSAVDLVYHLFDVYVS